MNGGIILREKIERLNRRVIDHTTGELKFDVRCFYRGIRCTRHRHELMQVFKEQLKRQHAIARLIRYRNQVEDGSIVSIREHGILDRRKLVVTSLTHDIPKDSVRELCAPRDLKTLKNVVDVVLDGLLSDKEFLRDLPIAIASDR